MGSFSLLLLTISLIIPHGYAQCNVERALPFFRRSVYEFSTELVKRIAEENENHFVTSAFSSYTILSALSLGAADETLAEIKQVLRLHPHKCFNGKFFEIIRKLTAKDPSNSEVQLQRSSTIFADDRLPINDEFVDKVENTRVSRVKKIPFYNFNDVADEINSYILQATDNKIDNVVEASDLEGVFIILIDAIFFKGKWKSRFPVENTEESAFYDEVGNQLGDVNLMFAEIEANITSVSQIGARVLELPYSNERYSMLFFLPENGNTISSIIDNLKKITLSSIFTLFSQTEPQRTFVQIPTFKINSDLSNMKEWLSDMGLRSMFDSTSASFPDLSDHKLFISNFIQKATVEVSEVGTEASAASAAYVSGRSMQLTTAEFTANRPFLFTIVDRYLEIALFTGAYSKPSSV